MDAEAGGVRVRCAKDLLEILAEEPGSAEPVVRGVGVLFCGVFLRGVAMGALGSSGLREAAEGELASTLDGVKNRASASSCSISASI